MVSGLDKYVNLPYAIEVIPERCTDGSICYRASHPELPGCMSHGDTPEEAEGNLAEARLLYIKTLLEKNLEVPLPSRTSSTVGEYAAQRVIWRVLDSVPDEGVVEQEKSVNVPEAGSVKMAV